MPTRLLAGWDVFALLYLGLIHQVMAQCGVDRIRERAAEEDEGAVALLVLTCVEIYLAYIQLPVLIFLVALVGLSVVKAALIIAYFMHLKFERFSLFMTLFPMLVFCIILLFIFMPDSMRLLHMRF